MTGTGAGERETVLRLEGITKRFGTLVANDAISLSLRKGEILGLLGENGAGKTTLMNILFGHYVADEGEIVVNGQALLQGDPHAALTAGIGMVHQHFTLADNLSVLDNIMLGTESLWQWNSGRSDAKRRIKELGQNYGLDVNPDALVSSLSVGERQRVEIIKALYRNVRILILDEPTAVLTPQESESLFTTLKRFVAQGLSIIFISHKLGEIINACDRVVILRSGRNVAEQPVAGTSRRELAELMVGRSISSPKAEAQAPGAAVLELRSVSVNQARHRLSDVDLTIHSGEVVGIAGVSGNGQSLLADVVSGLLRPETGRIDVAGQPALGSARQAVASGVGRIPEDRHSEGLIGDMNISENVISETYRTAQFSSYGFINWTKARNFALSIIDQYNVKCPGPEARVRLLSGGNMQKLILGRVMSQQPVLVLANQPTRGLDVGAVAYVHEQLLAARKRGAGVLLISEDLDELLALSDRVAVMFRGQLSSPLARQDVTLHELGLMMAGHGSSFEGENHAA